MYCNRLDGAVPRSMDPPTGSQQLSDTQLITDGCKGPPLSSASIVSAAVIYQKRSLISAVRSPGPVMLMDLPVTSPKLNCSITRLRVQRTVVTCPRNMSCSASNTTTRISDSCVPHRTTYHTTTVPVRSREGGAEGEGEGDHAGLGGRQRISISVFSASVIPCRQ